MELLDFRQTVYTDKNGFNKIILTFDEVVIGAAVSVLGVQKAVTGKKTELMIPKVNTKTIVAIVLKLPSGDAVTYTKMLKPVPALNICLIYTSKNHSDSFAYEHDLLYFQKLQKAIDLAGFFPDFKYTASDISFFRSYSRHKNDLSQLCRLVKSGNLEINPIFPNLQTHLLSYDELPRSFYGIKKLKETLGQESETVFFSDISGFSQSAVNVMASAGIKNIILAPSDFRNTSSTSEMPPVFRMPSASGTESVTVYIAPQSERNIFKNMAFQSDLDTDIKSEYFACRIAAGKQDFSEVEALIDRLSDRYAEYGTIPLVVEDDNKLPNLFVYAFCNLLSSKWQNPRFMMTTASEAMQNLKLRCAKGLPLVRGEFCDHLSDAVTGYPKLTGEKNRLSSLYFAIETACALSSAEKNGFCYPKHLLESSIDNLIEFCRYNILEETKKEQDKQFFNYNFLKRFPLESAKATLSGINAKPMLGKSDSFTTLFNPLLSKRKITATSHIYGNTTPPFECTDTPQCGYISLKHEKKDTKNLFSVTANTITTPYYNISYCQNTGRIFSIVSRFSLKELVDSGSDFLLGDFIYAVTDSKDGAVTDINTQKNISSQVLQNEKFVTIKTSGYEEQSRARVTKEIVFYKDIKNIDIHISFENALSLQGDFSDRFRKNIFIALPLLCRDAEFITGSHTGFINESAGRIPTCVRDFSVNTGWSKIDCGGNGIAIISNDARVFHYGSIRYNRFSQNYSTGSSSLFAYVLSNRLNSLSFASADDCRGDFSITLLPYSKGESETIQSKAADILTPFLAYSGYCPRHSKISADAEDLNLTAFKLSEDKSGFIIRFAESSGESKTITLNLPFKIRQAFYTNIIEENLLEIKELDGCSIKIRIQRFSYTTVKLVPESSHIPCCTADDTPEITDFFSYKDNFERNVVVWNKKNFKNSYKYDIICDGTKIATEDNLPCITQIYTTNITGDHSFEVKISR